ncbi:LysR substrate-binding domain-containing protein [Ruegeria arenilitoris]|uniref:LysR substrate-binding domain-containing protein n=1 Tax=Ruegeria arenilitoris TaxID=1173585 RepID=UPI00147DBA2B|nr:LysR substrate-binding domain-containing protein [Ruegeria arenilitoris]
MHQLWKTVSSSKHLVYFEAAARLQSITRAADEMNVKQPAVSAAIKQLETALGVQLFHREHRKIVLTSAGSKLYSDVSRSFDQILNSVNAVRQFTKNDHVTLNASSAFNFFWMMPKLQEFHQTFPDIDLRLQSSDREPDIVAENISLAIRRGKGTWEGCNAALIANEVLCPVASPVEIETRGRPASVEDLLRHRLIHLEEPTRERPGWVHWFDAFGVTQKPPVSGLRLNDYALVLQATLAGEGYALGWSHLTTPMAERGLLTALEDWSWETGYGFYLVWSDYKPLVDNAKRVRDWMLSKV